MAVSLGRLLVDFSMWCTIACLNRIVTSGRAIAAIFTIIFFAMLLLFVFISITCVLKYVRYPSSTELSITIQSQKFPRISVCNQNPMKRSAVDYDPALANISKLVAQFESGELQPSPTTTNGTVDSALLRMRKAQMMLRLLSTKLSNETRLKAGYSFSELITDAPSQERLAHQMHAFLDTFSADFSSFLHPDYGVCFTFTAGREITRPGLGQGLRLLMTVNQDSPAGSRFDFLPTTDSAAFWAVVHNDDEFPDFAKNGFRVGAGRQALVAITKEYSYSMNGCQHNCLQQLAAERCGCVDPLFRKKAAQRYCNTEKEADCLLSLPSSASSPTSSSSLCHCPHACTETLFEKVVSSSDFPSAHYKVATGTQQQREILLGGQGRGRQGDEDHNWDDYDAPATKVTSPASLPTTATPSECTPHRLPEALATLLNVDTRACRATYPDIYDNATFRVIQGWPCLSTKRCKSCVMYADTSASAPWSCSDYQMCTEKNNAAKHPCSMFFDAFDFIPTGIRVPNITGWEKAMNPSAATTCNSFTTASDDYNMCWLTHECSTTPSSSNLSALLDQTSPLIDKVFLRTIGAGITPCEFAKSAVTAAVAKLAPTGRMKRQTASADVPGFGSCEYANKNFQSAAVCIAWYRRNALLLHIFYEQLQVNSYTQGASYTFVSLISDISGHAGLWLGMSGANIYSKTLVSMVEILSLFVMIISNFVCGRNIVIDRENVQREAEKRNECEAREIEGGTV